MFFLFILVIMFACFAVAVKRVTAIVAVGSLTTAVAARLVVKFAAWRCGRYVVLVASIAWVFAWVVIAGV